MNILPYTNLPITHRARAYTNADSTDVARSNAEWLEQHAAILVCGIGDDYEHNEQTAYLEQHGAWK